MSASDKLNNSRDRYEARRRRLLKAVVGYTEGEPLPKGFMAEFNQCLEDVAFGLVRDGADFYALFTRDMAKSVDFSLRWPLATVLRGSGIELLVNPISFLFLSEEEAQALFKHEVLHLILDHHRREQGLKRRYCALAVDLALDVAVNQYIRSLPAFCERLASVNARLGLNLKDNETLEIYAKAIHGALAEHPEEARHFKKDHGIDFAGVHEAWTRGADPGRAVVQEKLSAMLSAARKAPLPKEVTALLTAEGTAVIDWRQALRRALISQPAGRRRTVTRRNRRQPERLDLKGELRDFVPQVIVAVDISASIQDGEIREYIREILGITRSYSRSLRILECDNAVRADYHILSPDDIRPMAQRRGGTAFSPVFEQLEQEGIRNCLLVYFTDGAGETKLTVKPHHQTLWVVSGKTLSLREPWGRVVYLDKARPSQEPVLGLQAMRELLHEWAR